MIASAGLLVAKTLTNATANPFLSGGAGSYNPVLALDVFQVQVGSIISHMHVFSCPPLVSTCATGALVGINCRHQNFAIS